MPGSPLPPAVSRRLLPALTAVALVATAGSLYFSEVAGLVPCDLCWYQRVLMYPLVPILGVAAVEDRSAAWKTALPLSTLGVGVAAYHSWLQVQPSDTCSVGGGCGGIDWQVAVFTIPRLSLLAFTLLTAGLLLVAREDVSAVDR